jgi:hypothetical protein
LSSIIGNKVILNSNKDVRLTSFTDNWCVDSDEEALEATKKELEVERPLAPLYITYYLAYT